ncbi:O-antigen ligase family protein [candidate division WOR-3 bacterium]|nr:O-antigen ligase family protein [candidate division WOR-3 bacterium]
MIYRIKNILYLFRDFSKETNGEKAQKISFAVFMLLFFAAPLFSKHRPLTSGGIFVCAFIATSCLVIISHFSVLDNIPRSIILSLIFALFCAVSSLFSKEIELSLTQTSYVFSWSAAFLCGFIFRKKRKVILSILIFSATAVLAYSAWQYFVIFPAMKEFFAANQNSLTKAASVISYGRVFSSFRYPNSFAGFILLVSGPIWVMIEKSGKTLKILLSAVWFSLVFFLYLTSSRLALAVGFFATLGALFYFYKKDKRMLFFILIPACIAIFAAGITNKSRTVLPTTEVHDRIATMGTDASSKISTFRGSVMMTLDNPVFGTGPGTFKRNYPRYRPEGQSDVPSSAHNIVLDLSATAGIIPSALFTFVLIMILLESFSTPLLFISFLALVVHSLGDWDFENIGLTLVFFSLAGAYSKPVQLRNSRFFRLAFLALSIPALFFSVRSGWAGFFYEKAHFYFSFGEPDSALLYSRKAIDINPFRTDYYFLGALSSRDLPRAENLFIEAAKRSPNWFEPYYHLGMISLSEKDTSSAFEYFLKANLLFPSSKEIKTILDSTGRHLQDT